MLKHWLLGNEMKSSSAGAIWNTLGGGLSAGQSAVILMFVAYNLELSISGIVSLAFATANFFMAIAKYGVRNFQVTDTRHTFTFQEYLYSRYVSVCMAIGALLVYITIASRNGSYTAEKTLIVLEICALKLLEAIEDVYGGDYQQQGRLDIAAKIMTMRLAVSTASICGLIAIGVYIGIALLVGIIISIAIDVVCIQCTAAAFSHIGSRWHPRKVLALLKSCFPLGVSAVLSIYVGNAPKFMIDQYMDEQVQGIFGYIMMPVFVIVLLNNFIYQPIIRKMGLLWEENNRKEVLRNIVRQIVLLALLMAFIFTFGGTCGLPILSIFYHTDLGRYKMEFLVLLLGGGFYALAYYLTVILTVIRQQNFVAVGYLMVTAFDLFCGRLFVSSNGVMGASRLYLCSNLLLASIYTLFLIKSWCGTSNVRLTKSRSR